MSRSASPPPEFFIDRSLGRHVVPDALRSAGVVVYAMADVYGEVAGQGLVDEDWLRDVGARGWVVLMKDDPAATARRSSPRSRPPRSEPSA